MSKGFLGMTDLLQNLVTHQAERRSAATALIFQQEKMSYGQLEESSNQLARILKAARCKKGDRVCLLIPKSPEAVVGILGILKADCIYVPLDPNSPLPRLAKMVEACEPRCILTVGTVAHLIDDLMQSQGLTASIPTIGCMDTEGITAKNFKTEFSQIDFQNYPGMPLEYQHTPQDAAYILFTSGSTGIPKGVVITHSNVIHFVGWANTYFGMCSSDINSGHSPFHFDLSTYDIFGTLAAGAQLHLVPPELNLLPNKLADFIRASELTQWFSVPSILSYMANLDVVQFNDFPALKRVIWCGEPFATPALMYWMKRLPRVAFTNLYGPTEATVASSYYTVPTCPEDERVSVPIGTACQGEQLLVLNEDLQPVSPGEIGNLYISGVGLSPGYWRDPGKTQSVFCSDPNGTDPHDRIYTTGDLARIDDDGLVYFQGRADDQIKSRGYRIELGEIVTALNTITHIQESAVVAINTNGFEGLTICCAYVPSPGVAVTPTTIRKEISKILPNYMLPSRWMAFQRLPKNSNCKIDYTNLKKQFLTR